jgi:hypothetical protein
MIQNKDAVEAERRQWQEGRRLSKRPLCARSGDLICRTNKHRRTAAYTISHARNERQPKVAERAAILG